MNHPFIDDVIPIPENDPLLYLVETVDFLGGPTWVTLREAIEQRRTFIHGKMRIYSTIKEIEIIQDYVGFRPIHVWRAAILYIKAWDSRRGKSITLRRFLSFIYNKEYNEPI